MIEDIHDIKECPDCASINIVYGIRDQVICRDCGLIFEPLAPAMEERFEVSHGLAAPRSKTPKKKKAKKAKQKKAKKRAAKRKPKKRRVVRKKRR